jgi:hypothetical protein
MREDIMSSLVAASALFLAGGLVNRDHGGRAPARRILNELFWAGLALSGLPRHRAGLEAAS